MMPPESRDPAYLWDMLEAAKRILEFTRQTTFEQYARNEMMQSAVERQLEIIGEAARRVSDTFKAAHPEIPWQPMIAQRNILAHEYGEVLDDRVWATVADDLPRLVSILGPLIPPLPPGSRKP